MRIDRVSLAGLLGRIGAAFAFLYPAVDEIFDPGSWLGYFPSWAHTLIPNDLLLLHGFGAIEALLALWLLSGYRAYIPALVMTAILLAIVAVTLPDFEVTFRDLSIASLTLALAALYWPPRTALSLPN